MAADRFVTYHPQFGHKLGDPDSIYVIQPDGDKSLLAQLATDSSGNVTGLVGPDGIPIPIGGDSILSTTHITFSSASAMLASGALLPFDTEERDDLDLWDVGTPATIALPVGVTQFRVGYCIRLNGASNGVASGGTATAATRRINTTIISGGVGEDEAALGILDANIQFPGIGAGAQALVWATSDLTGATLIYQSPWIDVANLATAPSGVAGEDTVAFSITHNAGASVLAVQAGSSAWLETLTPA